MHRRRFLQHCGLWTTATACAGSSRPRAWGSQSRLAHRVTTSGPLSVHPHNGRYFADATGRAVYLTGAHTWNNLSDMGSGDPPPPFDFTRYLDFLERHHHNFIRLWRWELTRWDTAATPEYTSQQKLFSIAPHPWARTGPGLAEDGQPKFDLRQLDAGYFDRLRERLVAARDRGIYVSIMLFEGWGLQHLPGAWQVHPFHPSNNVQGVDGDAGGDGRGLLTHTLQIPDVIRLQEAYIRHLVDTVNDLDNVLYEIANESGAYSIPWQYHWIRFIQAYQQTKPQQHPVGMTFPYSRDPQHRGANAMLFDSPADWISPNPEAPDGYDYRTNPPPADGSKVILSDTDHLWGIGGNPQWAWKSFLRGHNPLFMDPYDNRVLGKPDPESWDAIRASLGQTRQLAEQLNLASFTPRTDLASTGYCLASAGRQYVVYLPEGGSVDVDVSDTSGPLDVTWYDPVAGGRQPGEPIVAGDTRSLQAPSRGPAVLLLQTRI